MSPPRENKESALSVIGNANKSGLVERQLLKYIVARKLVPGDKLPSEKELLRQLRVSRSVIREGLKALEAVGVTTTYHGKGRFVSEFNPSAIADRLAIPLRFYLPSLQDILEVRMILETRFLSRAASLLTQDDLKEMEEVLRRMRLKLKECKTFVTEDMEFHRILFKRLNSLVMLTILEVFWKLFGRIEEGTSHSREQLAKAVDEHGAILAAIKKGELMLAEHTLRLHFVDAELRIAEVGKLADQ